MVAAAKLRRAQQRAEAGRPYATRMADVVARSRRGVTVGPQSPKLLAGTGKDDTHLIVLATGDRGLAGAFNSNIVRAARRKADELIADGKTVLFYLVGRKGRPVIQRLYPKAIIAQHDTSAIKAPGYADAQAIANDIDRPLHDRRHRRRPLLYAAVQVDPGAGAAGRADHPGPAGQGRAEDRRQRPTSRSNMSPTRRKSSPRCCRATSPSRSIARCSRTRPASTAAQMTAMDNATRNAGDMINQLSIQYNRQRQAVDHHRTHRNHLGRRSALT